MKTKLRCSVCVLLILVSLFKNIAAFADLCITDNNTEMQNHPKISVIIPVYNTELYLEECMNSVINQSLKDIEIICVNDGSKDNSLKILRNYEEKDGRVIVIDQTNQGVSAARNVGLSLARGEYVAFVDSDDYLNLTAYETSYNEAKDNDLDILNFGWKGFPEESSWDKWKSSPKERLFQNDSINAWFFCRIGANVNIWNKLYKRSFLTKNKARFETRLKYGEDLYFNFLLFPKAEKIKFVPNKFYNYRRNNNAGAINNLKIDTKLDIQINMIELMVNDWIKMSYSRGFEHELLSFFIDWTSYAIFCVDDQPKRVSFIQKFLKALGPSIYNPGNEIKLNTWAGQQLKKLENELNP